MLSVSTSAPTPSFLPRANNPRCSSHLHPHSASTRTARPLLFSTTPRHPARPHRHVRHLLHRLRPRTHRRRRLGARSARSAAARARPLALPAAEAAEYGLQGLLSSPDRPWLDPLVLIGHDSEIKSNKNNTAGSFVQRWERSGRGKSRRTMIARRTGPDLCLLFSPSSFHGGTGEPISVVILLPFIE